ncbi:hypothetical protein LHYA1_G006544 [Lachnellula hyalina]|uniref:Uncharacterized protein n=1 Tax=Lachnellula hyalina TaxID=1316788 RepID=A0A8H8TZD6_9HELO|nr:uncharacterized protein LHYA1_G006544 [Lachnellula hyalina]TVY25717.1 hypothetical protein LHYA1_G006544 [Lachnellula hyalina]
MYRPPTGDLHQLSPSTPSRLAHSNLTIRTSSTQSTRPSPAPQATASPPKQPYPSYPIPIPPKKLDKALSIYKTYKEALKEEEFAKLQNGSLSATTAHHGFHLSVPGTSAPGSVTSHTSSGRLRAGSASTSQYGATEISSVMSFNGNESPLSANPHIELSTFDGKKVKRRTRKQFDKPRKAKTALIRHLGSCWVCHDRRVPCDLFTHHDVQSLEDILQARSNRRRPHSQHHSRSSLSNASRQNARSLSAGHATIEQPDALLGLGQNEELQSSAPFDMTYLDIPSPAPGEPSPGISAPATIYHNTPDFPALGPNPYGLYQNGNMFPIGVQHGSYFMCSHLDGCFERFADLEQLQNHFEVAHFAFTRIDPAHRYVCLSCQHYNETISAPCYHCHGFVEIWIYGNFIHNPSHHRYSPDGQDLSMNSASSPYYPSAYNMPTPNVPSNPENPDMNGRHFNNTRNYDFQPNNSYGSGPSPRYDYNPPSNGNQFHGSQFQLRAWNSVPVSEKTPSLQLQHQIQASKSRKRKAFFTLALLITALTLCCSYTWLMTKARTLIPHSSPASLPIIGFVGIVASFAMCSSVKHFTVRRAQCSPQKCPLYVLGTRSRPMRVLRERAPDTYVRDGMFS